MIMPRPGIVIVPLMMPRLSPCPSAAEVDGASMMLLPLPRALKLVPPTPCASASRCSAGQHLPLDAELRGLVGRDLDDQRLDEHLRAPHVELLDDRAQVVVDGLGRHDDQRVVGDVGLDRRAARGERRRCRLPVARGAADAVGAGAARQRRHVRRTRVARAERGVRQRRGRGDAVAAVAAAGQQRAQRLRDARRLGVLQVDDEHVAAGAAAACRAARSAAARARRAPDCRRGSARCSSAGRRPASRAAARRPARRRGRARAFGRAAG